MKYTIAKITVAAILAVTVSVEAGARTHPKSIVVVSPSQLPETAQRKSEAMYLHYTGDGRAVLYLEQDQGRTLAVLDVSDPAAIRAVAQISIAARSSYDFVQNLRDSAVLIQYRDQSGFAVINFKKFKKPVLTEAPRFQHPADAEALGHSGLLLASRATSNTPAPDPQYEVIDISNPSKPTELATVPGVKQRLVRRETGTSFFLSNNGLTVVRRLSVEADYEAELNAQRGN